MFVQISPNENDVGETLCSLNFTRVWSIELGQAKKQVDVGELSRYKLMGGRAKQDSKNKNAHNKSMEERIQALEVKNKVKDMLTLNLREKSNPTQYLVMEPNPIDTQSGFNIRLSIIIYAIRTYQAMCGTHNKGVVVLESLH
ncbi:Kinesin-like protein KIN-14R [Zea mays]|uniref:Kinesin-like protein KIN-14R n=1 Tax=Zea mays TaxID=4577 RepID=A0A3L6EZN6_MAIZE|nr:Kinesin-like protein KIN-14R [Zea mays]